MAPADPSAGEPQGVKEVVNDLWLLIRAYAKQETIDPLMSLKRFLAWGIPGALILLLGIIYGTLAIIRVLQTETGDHLTGSWNWVPYLVGLLFAVLVGFLAFRSIHKPFRTKEQQA